MLRTIILEATPYLSPSLRGQPSHVETDEQGNKSRVTVAPCGCRNSTSIGSRGVTCDGVTTLCAEHAGAAD